MKKWPGYFLKIVAVISGLLIVAILFFTLLANLRETKTRQEAAPSTGRFVQAGDIELFIQEMGRKMGSQFCSFMALLPGADFGGRR